MATGPNHQIAVVDVLIESSETTSAEVNLNGLRLAAIEFPATITGMTALSIQGASASGGTFKYVTDKDDSTTNIELTATASKIMPVDMTETVGLRFIKLVSTDGAGSANAVSQDTTITLHLTGVL